MDGWMGEMFTHPCLMSRVTCTLSAATAGQFFAGKSRKILLGIYITQLTNGV